MSHDDIRAALEARSDLPWRPSHGGPVATRPSDTYDVLDNDGETVAASLFYLDAHLIANAPTWLAELLGEVPGMPGLHSLRMHPNASSPAGLLLFRFNAPVVFFNAPYFRREVLAAVKQAGPELKWFVLDMLPVTMVDSTGYYVMMDLADNLRARGIEVVVAGRLTEFKQWAEQHGFQPAEDQQRSSRFPTLRQAVRAYKLLYPAVNSEPSELQVSET